MFCKFCSADITDKDKFCPNCGEPNGNFVQAPGTAAPQVKVIINPDQPSVYAVLSLVFGLLGGWLGLVFGIIGLVKYKSHQVAQRIMCIVGIVAFAFWILVFFMLLI